MSYYSIFVLIPLAGVLLIPWMKVRQKGIVTLLLLFINVVISSFAGIESLSGSVISSTFAGSFTTGPIPVRIDALSGWFILIINLLFVTGGLYGIHYLKSYQEQKNKLTLHSISFLFQHAALISICGVQNSFVFLIAWEILALTSFVLIILDHEKISTVKAGITYLIQAHFSIIFLLLAFIWVTNKTGNYDFQSISNYSATLPTGASLILFGFLFVAFAIKAGFVPFHTWLPYAHPAAPSHISGMMSGVIIKIGIFGILRMLLIVKTDMEIAGYFILLISIISGIYGVMLAIIQHNLKKLLAYHSIENIGIIGIGIGLGCIGIGTGNQVLATLGFAGALLHTLNHALFKSLLFYAAGNVYQSIHTMELEKMGGLIKRMPQTAGLFLLASLAICGIPPFNGFISEFILYSGLYHWLSNGLLFSLLIAISAAAALALIGGLALMCFTKAFGVVFLGNERVKLPDTCKEASIYQLLPLYLLGILIVLIGIFPVKFVGMLSNPLRLFTTTFSVSGEIIPLESVKTLQSLNWAIWILILMVAIIYSIRKVLSRLPNSEKRSTWGCGYAAATARQQYTAASFVRSYSKLFSQLLIVDKDEQEVAGIFPAKSKYATHSYDKVEKILIDKPLKYTNYFMNRFMFLNNGRLQLYILYGILFIITVLSLPIIYTSIEYFLDILKNF